MLERRKVLAWLKKNKIAVLKGGWSSERSISLKTGEAVEKSFKRLGIKAFGIDVKRTIASDLVKKKINFCFLALHGPFGEDGRIQSLLEILNIRYTGCGPLASGLAMDKNMSKKLFFTAGVPTAPWAVLNASDTDTTSASLAEVQKMFVDGPVFVKPVDQGSAIGVTKVEKYVDLGAALKSSFKLSPRAMVERFIAGREFTVGIIGDSALPVVEIIPQHEFYDFHSKYAKGGSRHVIPANISPALTIKAQKIALEAFRSLGCEVYGRVDIMMETNGNMSVLEVNTIPGMTDTSLLPEAAKSIGIEFDELVLQIIELSLKRHAAKI